MFTCPYANQSARVGHPSLRFRSLLSNAELNGLLYVQPVLQRTFALSLRRACDTHALSCQYLGMIMTSDMCSVTGNITHNTRESHLAIVSFKETLPRAA